MKTIRFHRHVRLMMGMLSITKHMLKASGFVASSSFRHHESPAKGAFFGARRIYPQQLSQSSSFVDHGITSIDTGLRKELLDKNLQSLDIDATQLHQAALLSIADPTKGYDGRYGKSAIKTYRSFLCPKVKMKEAYADEFDQVQLQAAARRTSLQIQFLLARHKSHQANWVRHHDANDTESSSSSPKFPLVLLLDNLRSAENVGSLFRTADAAGVSKVITCGITPHPNGSGAEKLRKTALGADAIVESCHFETTRQGLQYMRDKEPNYTLIGMETTAQSVVYTEHDFGAGASGSGGGVCLVLGNEVTGVDTELLPLWKYQCLASRIRSMWRRALPLCYMKLFGSGACGKVMNEKDE